MANINSMNVGGQLSMIEDTAAREMEASAYDPTQTYAKEDICIYNDKLYEANTAITTAEAFNIAHWTETTLGKIAQKHRDSISQLTENFNKLILIQGTNLEIRYNGAHATLYINKEGVNLAGGNINGQILVTLPDGIEIANSALVGKIAPVLDASWTPTDDYVTLGVMNKKNITVRCKSNHTNCVIIFSATFPRQYLILS